MQLLFPLPDVDVQPELPSSVNLTCSVILQLLMIAIYRYLSVPISPLQRRPRLLRRTVVHWLQLAWLTSAHIAVAHCSRSGVDTTVVLQHLAAATTNVLYAA